MVPTCHLLSQCTVFFHFAGTSNEKKNVILLFPRLKEDSELKIAGLLWCASKQGKQNKASLEGMKKDASLFS